MIWQPSDSAGQTWISQAGPDSVRFRFWAFVDNPFYALFVDTFRLRPGLERLAAGLSTVTPFFPGALERIFLIVIVTFLLGVLIYYWRALEKSEDERIRLGLLVLGCVTSGVFLVTLSVLYRSGLSGVFRYYLPLAPLVFLIYLRIGQLLVVAPAGRWFGVSILTVCLFGMLAYGPREYYRTLKGESAQFREGVTFLVENLERIRDGEPFVVVGSVESFATAEPIRVVHIGHSKLWQRVYTKEPLWLFVLQRRAPTPAPRNSGSRCWVSSTNLT